VALGAVWSFFALGRSSSQGEPVTDQAAEGASEVTPL
jgi:hypothetical protein